LRVWACSSSDRRKQKSVNSAVLETNAENSGENASLRQLRPNRFWSALIIIKVGYSIPGIWAEFPIATAEIAKSLDWLETNGNPVIRFGYPRWTECRDGFKSRCYPRVIELIKNRPEKIELVLTGRNAPKEIIAIADYVTEMKAIKHPADLGIKPRKGIEY